MMRQQNKHSAQQPVEKKNHPRWESSTTQHMDLRADFPKWAWNQNGAPQHENSTRHPTKDFKVQVV